MSKANILVVEDERIVGRDIQATLQKAGYAVPAVVSSGMQAIRKAAELQPDLVLMDVRLAGEMDGIEAARRIRLHREVPVVYLTANGDRKTLDRTKETEPIAFIRKPYEEEELLTTIEVSLHQYRLQKERALAALQISEARYQELFESARDGIAVTDLAGFHLKCNQAYLDLLGYRSFDKLPSRALADLTAPEFRRPEALIIQEQTLRRGYSDEYEKEYLCRSGARVVVSARSWIRRDERGHPSGLWLMVRDITMQKEAERRILEYQSQLQSLMRDLSLTEERERKQIAADIHDRICQTLAVCQMRLGAVAQSPAPPEAVSRAAHEIGELLDRTIKDTSSLIFELSPPVLHQLGLVAALEWFGEKIQQRHRIRVSVRARDSAQPVPEDQRASLFRAACELINNAVKHAGAKRIWVVLEQSAWCQRIQVIDNGAGFTPAEELGPRDKPGGFGLFHIRERLRGWGGTLEIHSRPGSGTRAVLTAPMDVVPLEK